ncbi:Protein of unknown function [Gryllus bimaculatus]|nr:Protein of unknown function [Gryllus bimaculatus]
MAFVVLVCTHRVEIKRNFSAVYSFIFDGIISLAGCLSGSSCLGKKPPLHMVLEVHVGKPQSTSVAVSPLGVYIGCVAQRMHLSPCVCSYLLIAQWMLSNSGVAVYTNSCYQDKHLICMQFHCSKQTDT